MSPGIQHRLLAAQPDERLVALVRHGHERAFEAVVHRYRRPLMRYCRRRLALSEARAEDVVQQALLNAWVALRRGAEVRELRPWLYRIAHNAAVNAMRSERPSVEEDAAEETPPIRAGRTGSAAELAAAASLDETLELRDALASMAALPPMQREVMVRTAVAGHSHEEVASALGITDGAVRGLLYRARASIRAAAAAVTPSPLIAWAAGATAPAGVASERIAELAAGGGAAGLAGLAAKGGVAVITAGALITSAAIAPSHRSSPTSPQSRQAAGRAVASRPDGGRADAHPSRPGSEPAGAEPAGGPARRTAAPARGLAPAWSRRQHHRAAPRQRRHGNLSAPRRRHGDGKPHRSEPVASPRSSPEPKAATPDPTVTAPPASDRSSHPQRRGHEHHGDRGVPVTGDLPVAPPPVLPSTQPPQSQPSLSTRGGQADGGPAQQGDGSAGLSDGGESTQQQQQPDQRAAQGDAEPGGGEGGAPLGHLGGEGSVQLGGVTAQVSGDSAIRLGGSVSSGSDRLVHTVVAPWQDRGRQHPAGGHPSGQTGAPAGGGWSGPAAVTPSRAVRSHAPASWPDPAAEPASWPAPATEPTCWPGHPEGSAAPTPPAGGPAALQAQSGASNTAWHE